MFPLKGPAYIKSGLTGTGSAQTLTHNLGYTPNYVLIIPEASCSAVPFWTPASCSKTVISVTVPNAVPYSVFAGTTR